MKVLSLDQSFTNCAWSIWENNKLYDFGVISTGTSESLTKRIVFIVSKLKDIILENEISQVVLEGIILKGRITPSSPSLAGLFYCIEILCDSIDIPCEDIPPPSVKKVWSGKGNASKVEMEKACPESLLSIIMSSPYKTLNKGRRDLVDSFAVYKAWVELRQDKKEDN